MPRAKSVARPSDNGASESRTLVDGLYSKLKRSIISGEVRPGSRLSPGDLAGQHEVSSTVVREALTRLSAEQLVRSSPQQGFAVQSASREALRDLVYVRSLVDGEGLGLSVRAGDLAWKGALLSAHYVFCHTPLDDGQQTGPEARKFVDVHRMFHSALVAGCGSPRLIAWSRQLFDEVEIYRRYLRFHSDGDHIRNTDDHQKIVDAALNGDAETAVSILLAHFEKTAQSVLDTGLLDEVAR